MGALNKIPTVEEMKMAQEVSRRLSRLAPVKREIEVQIPEMGDEATITLTPTVLKLLTDIVTAMARGDAVTVIPMHAEISTNQAADILNVSRPYLIGLLEKGEIQFKKVGSHRRILLEDVVGYKEVQDQKSREAMNELAQITQQFERDQKD